MAARFAAEHGATWPRPRSALRRRNPASTRPVAGPAGSGSPASLARSRAAATAIDALEAARPASNSSASSPAAADGAWPAAAIWRSSVTSSVAGRRGEEPVRLRFPHPVGHQHGRGHGGGDAQRDPHVRPALPPWPGCLAARLRHRGVAIGQPLKRRCGGQPGRPSQRSASCAGGRDRRREGRGFPVRMAQEGTFGATRGNAGRGCPCWPLTRRETPSGRRCWTLRVWFGTTTG